MAMIHSMLPLAGCIAIPQQSASFFHDDPKVELTPAVVHPVRLCCTEQDGRDARKRHNLTQYIATHTAGNALVEAAHTASESALSNVLKGSVVDAIFVKRYQPRIIWFMFVLERNPQCSTSCHEHDAAYTASKNERTNTNNKPM